MEVCNLMMEKSQDVDCPVPRKPYAKPQLLVYGSLKLLTQSGGATIFEGASGKGKRR